ncbi:alpha/beta hydrolase [Nafulsella turpanensis]|uniref:alpha/beta hydrolase n=1 Tax=Nafulsella turpanensis TaxID=1265690 RepID=UPI000344D5AB|nr:alpha/beta hydrolase-fold protein [Nafulsella turpanensis]
MGTSRDIYKRGRLTVRWKERTGEDKAATGLQPLGLSSKRDGFIYIPATYQAEKPASLALMLHGAGGQAEHGLSLLRRYADEQNIILLAPASRGRSWDIIAGESFDQDVIFIDQALSQAFENYSIDASKIAIGGFSDGASYALCLGLTNGDLFTHVLAFSPGFVFTIEKTAKPAVFISHGTRDAVLPVEPCSRQIVSQLQREDYSLHYQEFEGAHEVPPAIAKAGIEWFRSTGSH